MVCNWAIRESEIGLESPDDADSHQVTVISILVLSNVIQSDTLDIDLVSHSFTTAGALVHSYKGEENT